MAARSSLGLNQKSIKRLNDRMPSVSDDVVEAIIEEVPYYADALSGPMGQIIRDAVQVALTGFITVASTSTGDSAAPRAAALSGAYDLGRGEARSGRSAEALLSAYRIGARVSWERLSAETVQAGADAAAVANFASLVFDYIDQLSAASVSGHADEIARSGQSRERLLQGLADDLLSGTLTPSLVEQATAAGWSPPVTFTVVLVPEAQARSVLTELRDDVLRARTELVEGQVVLLVPDAHDRRRVQLLRQLRNWSVVVGPARPWQEAASSFERAERVLALGLGPDSEQHLARLILGSDRRSLVDLRAKVLQPLEKHTESTRGKLVETLRAWLLFQGRREDMAKALFVHPQTVRYRMGQLRESYGERLEDPQWILDLTLALGEEPPE
ncbi:MAG TPA: helix-turn-helix domain-containing protein [Marmoricola sp.]|nr:helix-turn-helix domain-containing protein [Marmoricola sp.]